VWRRNGTAGELQLISCGARLVKGQQSMRTGACGLLASLFVGVSLLLGACGHHHSPSSEAATSDPDINILPADYKRDILAAMHAYLNDPTGIRDAAISEPVLKAVGNLQRYVVYVRFDAKKRGNEYAGVKEIAAVFLVGRFDHFVEKPQEQCAGLNLASFPELQKLPR
jgi:hypothetical protein